MSTSVHRRPWLHPVARAVTVGALSAAVVLGADRLGAVSAEPDSGASGERVAATSVTGYCPGDPFGDNPEIEVTGSTAAYAAPGTVLQGLIRPSDEPGDIAVADLADEVTDEQEEAPRQGPGQVVDDGLGTATRVRARENRAPGVAMSQSFVAGGEQATGLTAVPCSGPTADAWLVSGGPQKGRQEHLVLTNPGANPVSVTIEALGGESEESVVVPPQERTIVLVDAIGGTDSPQAVHVTTSNGLVVPTMVDHHLDGLTPAGVETSVPTTAPNRRLVIPAGPIGRSRGIVVGVPGASDAVVQVRGLGQDGSHGATVETVPAGSAVDLDLPQDSQAHAWLVESDEPVVAAAHGTEEATDGTRDMSWSVATAAVRSLGGVALPTDPGEGTERSITLAADEGPATVEVLTLGGGDVSTEEVSLTAGHATVVPVGDADAVWVRPTSGAVHAAAVLAGGDGARRARVTSMPIQSLRVAVRDVDVVHRR